MMKKNPGMNVKPSGARKAAKAAPVKLLSARQFTPAAPAPKDLKPIELNLNSPALNKSWIELLPKLGEIAVKLPKDVLIPALGGDPGAEIPGAEPEPVYTAKARANIQGNIIPGFNKDHQHFLFFRIRNVRRTKAWLRWIAPLISSMDDVLARSGEHSVRLGCGLASAIHPCVRPGSTSPFQTRRSSGWRERPRLLPSVKRVFARVWPRVPPISAIRASRALPDTEIAGSSVDPRMRRTSW
jgi:hypothetical protein